MTLAQTPARLRVSGSLSPVFLGSTSSFRIGTFAPSFDPFSYTCVFGIDDVCNMDSPNYTRAVASQVFQEIGGGQFSGSTFSRTISVTQPADLQLWMFVFSDPSPDSAMEFALFTGSGPEWRTPVVGSRSLSANSASIFVHGFGGNGGPIYFDILPIPEPSVPSLAASAAGCLVLAKGVRRRFKA
jgi:hypothetical protein